MIFARTLGDRWREEGITVNSLHPGVVNTGLMSGWENPVMKSFFGVVQKFFISPDEGARTSIFLASDPSVAAVTGMFFSRSAQRPHNLAADDRAIQEHLWAESLSALAEAGITMSEPWTIEVGT